MVQGGAKTKSPAKPMDSTLCFLEDKREAPFHLRTDVTVVGMAALLTQQ
jgi:hypothetical protein